MVKLFLFPVKTKDKLIVLVCSKRINWKLVYIDLRTDNITIGQCFTKHNIYTSTCDVSHCGNFFVYGYTDQQREPYGTYTIVSRVNNLFKLHLIFKVPCFTAEYFAKLDYQTMIGGYFDEDNKLCLYHDELSEIETTGSFVHTLGHHTGNTIISKFQESFIDFKSREIKKQDGKIYVNNKLLVDLSLYSFEKLTKQEVLDRMK